MSQIPKVSSKGKESKFLLATVLFCFVLFFSDQATMWPF